LLSKATFFSVK